jgi:hypothetical protein
VTLARASGLGARVLVAGNPKARATEVGVRVLWRRIPIPAGGSAEAAVTADAIPEVSTINFGRASGSATTTAGAGARLRSATQPPEDPIAGGFNSEGYAGIIRWRLTDTRTGEQTVLYINPNTMSAPPVAKALERVAPVRDGQNRMMSFQTPVTASDWSWGGVIIHQAQHDMLRSWAARGGTVQIQDHLGRVFDVLFRSFTPTEKAGRRPESWKMTYSINTSFLRRRK